MHDIGIVHGHASDRIGALGFDRFEIMKIARNMQLVAGAGERTRHSEEHHLLALEYFA